jgi:tetratricopeptide (TPR) repeat protein
LADLYELHIYEYAKALPLYERALAILERALGSNHPEVAETLNDIALVHDNQGMFSEALPLFLRAVRIAEVTLGRTIASPSHIIRT